MDDGNAVLVNLAENSNSQSFSTTYKSMLEAQNRELLERDLLANRTKFSAGPYEAHIQFSNFCNMSCIMCWAGENPRPRKMPQAIIDRISSEFGPHLSVVTPYSGSEPLVLSWDETRDFARQHGILLCITTNVQFLDEKLFHELKDITETLYLSIDSHIEEVFAKIRPRSKPEKVFKNLQTTARLCSEFALETIVNIVYMTENAASLPETIDYMARIGIPTVNVIQLLDVNYKTRMSDPLLQFSKEYNDHIKSLSIARAKLHKMRLKWNISGFEVYDFRENPVTPNQRKISNDAWDWRMKHFFPGFCRNAYNRLRVDGEGDVAPCCYATQGELSLGNVCRQSFEEIWNGAEAQDLRRGMYCDDVPTLCRHCRFRDLPPEREYLPFMTDIEQGGILGLTDQTASILPILTLVGPDHGKRYDSSPLVSIERPPHQISAYLVVLAEGGESTVIQGFYALPDRTHDAPLDTIQIPESCWESLRHNVGYWVSVWATCEVGEHPTILRTKTSRCIVRHRQLERISGSTLRYPESGLPMITDLGGHKQVGFDPKTGLQERPKASPLATKAPRTE